MYTVWEPWGAVYAAIPQSHDYVTTTYKKDKVWAYTFDVYHYLNNPWTWSLRDKRLLIVSPLFVCKRSGEVFCRANRMAHAIWVGKGGFY